MVTYGRGTGLFEISTESWGQGIYPETLRGSEPCIAKSDVSKYGEGSRVLNVGGSPKPPNVERKNQDTDTALSDETL
jgi:hypothetical protein